MKGRSTVRALLATMLSMAACDHIVMRSEDEITSWFRLVSTQTASPMPHVLPKGRASVVAQVLVNGQWTELASIGSGGFEATKLTEDKAVVRTGLGVYVLSQGSLTPTPVSTPACQGDLTVQKGATTFVCVACRSARCDTIELVTHDFSGQVLRRESVSIPESLRSACSWDSVPSMGFSKGGYPVRGIACGKTCAVLELVPPAARVFQTPRKNCSVYGPELAAAVGFHLEPEVHVLIAQELDQPGPSPGNELWPTPCCSR